MLILQVIFIKFITDPEANVQAVFGLRVVDTVLRLVVMPQIDKVNSLSSLASPPSLMQQFDRAFFRRRPISMPKRLSPSGSAGTAGLIDLQPFDGAGLT